MKITAERSAEIKAERDARVRDRLRTLATLTDLCDCAEGALGLPSVTLDQAQCSDIVVLLRAVDTQKALDALRLRKELRDYYR